MIKKISIGVMLGLSLLIMAPQVMVLADSKSVIQGGVNDANGGAPPKGATTPLNDTIGSVINLLSVAVGIISVIMIIIGGFRYITSSGNPEGAKNAKNTILYAIIGLIIVALAQLIVRFVLNKVTS